MHATWRGIVGGETRIETPVLWKKGQTLEPNWPAAPPGIVTYNDLPLILPRGVVPTG